MTLIALLFWSHFALSGTSVPVEPGQRFEDFQTDPGWIGHRNRPDPSVVRTVIQDFGYSPTHHADGKAPGEIGGRVSRTLMPAFYATPIATKTLRDRLTASGRFAVTQATGNSGVLLGWFHHTSRGWRTPNSMVIRLDGNGDTYWVFFEYGTRHGLTGSGATFEGERYQTTPSRPYPADGSVHTWSFTYDPEGANGDGEMILMLDGRVHRAPLRPGHKEDGALFDRFGILNQQTSGEYLTLYVDDLVVDGVSYDFNEDPRWEGLNNRRRFQDSEIRPYHNFGYSPDTNHAGGQPGEIGGLIWRIDPEHPEQSGYYAAPVANLTLSDRLRASGKIAMTRASADSAVLIGWFCSRTYQEGAPPKNFVGILVEGPSRVGHYFRPAYANAEGRRGVAPEGPLLLAASGAHTWSLDYNPNANGGQGRITVTLDGQEVFLDMPLGGHRSEGAIAANDGTVKEGGQAIFDRFGVLSYLRGGHYVEIFLDDVAYTAERPQ